MPQMTYEQMSDLLVEKLQEIEDKQTKIEEQELKIQQLKDKLEEIEEIVNTLYRKL